MSAATRTPRTTGSSLRIRVPGIIISVGISLWKIVCVWANVDFLFSLREGPFSASLQRLSWGWWILALVGVAWIIFGGKMSVRQKVLRTETTICIAIISFLFGVLLTAHWSEASPGVFKMWAFSAAGCQTTVDTSRLTNFANKDDMILICGAIDPAIDMNKDSVIAKSTRFDITGSGEVPMFAPFGGALLPRLYDRPAGEIVGVWHVLALVPKKLKDDQITSLDDIRKSGGRILDAPAHD